MMFRKQQIDKRIDLWALGLLIYELVFGEKLFSAETD